MMDTTKPRFSMSGTVFLLIGLVILIIIVLAIASTGCHSRNENGGQVLFEDGLNLQIGHPIKDMEKFPHEKKPLEDGATEYVFSEENGCSYAFIVNSEGIIESWRYVSDPSLCKRSFSFGPF